MQETRGDSRRAADLGGVGENDVGGAEQLREIVGGEADAPLRQVEAELVPHRPVQPGIDARIRRPDAFHQAAENHAVIGGEARFQRAVDPQPRACDQRPPHDAVAERGLEHVGIIRKAQDHAAGATIGGQFVERLRQRLPVMALKRQRDAAGIGRELRDHVAMARHDVGQIMGLAGGELFERRERHLQPRDQVVHRGQRIGIEPRPRLGAMQQRWLAARELRQFAAKHAEVAPQSGAAALGSGAAQQRQFERGHGRCDSSGWEPKPE